MAKIIIIFILCFTKICQCVNNTTYCAVKVDDPGFAIVDLQKGKDGTLAGAQPSSYLGTPEPIKIKIQLPFPWEEKSSTHHNAFLDMPVLDNRWESFRTNHDELNYAKFNGIYSVRFFNHSFSPNITTGKWQHLKLLDSKFYLCEDSNCDNLIQNNFGSEGDAYINTTTKKGIWKFHNYSYIYTNENTTKTQGLFSKNSSCSHLHNGCFIIYLAACNHCTFTINLQGNDSSFFNKTFYGNDTWKMQSIDIKNVSNCFNLSVTTFSETTGWWAVGDSIYLLNTSSKETKRYIQVDKVENKSCENALGKNFTFAYNIFEKPNMQSNLTNLETKKSSTNNIYLLFLLLLLIPLILLIIFGTRCYYKKSFVQSNQIEEIALLSSQDNIISSIPSVKAAEFNNYVTRMFENNAKYLQKQFSSVVTGYLKDATEGQKPENVEKNRYKIYYPYDENRVVLDRKWSSTSDYINASYVEGVNNSKEYIVTQNPKKNTVDDFFAMIWQENVENIVMLTSEADNYISYWPDDNHKQRTYNQISVSLVKITTREFYIHRILEFTGFGETRTINHIQFFAWTTDVLCTYVFLDFVNHMLQIPHSSAPVIIHCLAGIGRSGTMVLCDIALRSAKITGSYNIFEMLKQLRQCRVDMIPNLRQYQLAHLIIYESLNYIETSVEIDIDFPTDFNRLIEGNTAKKLWLHCLQNNEWLYEAITPYVPCVDYPKQNRYNDTQLLPVEHSRVILTNSECNYIHAMHVNNYLQKQKYIVAQQPLAGTLSKFWLMVVENKVEAIVNLNELDLGIRGDVRYFPTRSTSLETNERIIIKLVNEEQHSNYDKIDVDIFLNDEFHYSLCVFVAKGWHKIKHIPESTDVVLALWKATELYRNRQSRIVFCCEDGINSSSLMVAFYYIADKMLIERKCDIVGAIRAIRRTHTKFVNFEQYIFLHHCALALYKNYIYQ